MRLSIQAKELSLIKAVIVCETWSEAFVYS